MNNQEFMNHIIFYFLKARNAMRILSKLIFKQITIQMDSYFSRYLFTNFRSVFLRYSFTKLSVVYVKMGSL